MVISRCWQDTQKKDVVSSVGLTSHDSVLGTQQFGDLADFDGSVDVLHNIICKNEEIR